MKQAIIVLLLVLLGAWVAIAQQAPPTKEKPAAPAKEKAAAGAAEKPTGFENLYKEIGVGIERLNNQDTTGLGYGLANWGFPVVPEWNLGGQVGGKITARRDDPDWLAAAGLFQRDIALGSMTGAWAVEGIYQNTQEHADLLSIKPILGVEFMKDNYLVLTGIIGVNEEHLQRAGGVVTAEQEAVDTAMLLWGTQWMDKFRTELGAGYEFSDIDRMVLGVHAAYQIDKMMNANLTVQSDFRDAYFVSVGLGLDLGRNGANGSFNNITKTRPSDYTPFPLGSLPVPFYETHVLGATETPPSTE